ncbi:MAG: hypothetical protein AAF515_07235 [Pseudomonadota bacterium]
MATGREILSNLERTLRGVREEAGRIGGEVKVVADSLSRNRARQAQATRELAKLRLDEIAQGDLLDNLDSAERQALAALEARDAAFAELEKQIDAGHESLRRREAERDMAHHHVDIAAQDLARAEAGVQEALEADSGYQAQLATCRDAEAVADSAAEKAQTAEADRAEKGRPFEADKLFMYLWNRHYGTPDYRAGVFTRALDGWVARVIAFEDNRATFWNLCEIPRRLREHANSLRAHAETEIGRLAALEERAAEVAEIPRLRERLNEAELEQDAADEAIVTAEDTLDRMFESHSAYGTGHDEHTRRSLSILADAMHSKRAGTLRAEARSTYDRRDDRLVTELIDLREEEGLLDDELEGQRRSQSAQLARLKDLESVRRRFKSNRYDDFRSSFRDGDALVAMFAQFARGLLDGGELWRVLQRHQRHADVGAWPDFGSGGFGRTRKGPWHWPGPRGGGWRLPRGGGYSSRGGSFGRRGGFGGFGGGRGGGGFRTGGGF